MALYYPPGSFYFKLAFTGISTDADAAFQEASGITAELGIEEIAEGGENRFKYRLPQPAKYNNLVLKRGLLTAGSQLADWCLQTIESDFTTPIQPKTITVSLLDPGAKVLMAWDFINAWPVKWSVSDLKSQENALAIETLEFAFNYFKKA